MKYQQIIDRIKNGELTRLELKALRENATAKLRDGDKDAQAVLLAMDTAIAKDAYIIFMGFCPNADLANRLDTQWREQGVCTFDFDESPLQMERFRSIHPGDLLVLKKRQVFGKTMRIYGHGRVRATRTGEDGRRFLEMAWATQDEIMEVSLMGCDSTVNLRALETVEAEMPPQFFQWLKE